MAKAKEKAKKRGRRPDIGEPPPPKGYVIVHRNSAGDVVEVGDTFHDEHQSLHSLMMLTGSINFFLGDSLHMEEDIGQREHAINR